MILTFTLENLEPIDINSREVETLTGSTAAEAERQIVYTDVSMRSGRVYRVVEPRSDVRRQLNTAR